MIPFQDLCDAIDRARDPADRQALQQPPALGGEGRVPTLEGDALIEQDGMEPHEASQEQTAQQDMPAPPDTTSEIDLGDKEVVGEEEI
jgi:hypothetical protein